MAHLAMHEAPKALFQAFSHIHIHVEFVGLMALVAGLLCAAMFAAVHCYGAAVMSALTGFVIFRASSQ